MPAVSIILPTFNRSGFLRQAIDSVFAQTYVDWELVVADDGSGEETQAYLRDLSDPRVRTIWLEHCGNPARVRNAAIQAARGEYLAFLDSDDLWAPSKLQAQIAALGARPRARWSYCRYAHIDGNGNPITPGRARPGDFPDGWVFEPLLKLELAIPMPAVIAARDLVQALGGFDEQQRFGEFHDLCLRLAMHSEVVALQETLCWVRTHDQHYSADRISAKIGWMRLYEKMTSLAPNRRLQSHCRRMRSETALELARLQGNLGDYRGSWTTVKNASRYSWYYPLWWYGAVKALIRPHVPAVAISTLARRR
jgi:glycosyltransferase involved in cell wall biosynthesis